MSLQSISRCYRSIINHRFFSQSAKCLDSKASEAVNKTSSSTAQHSESVIGPIMYVPNNFDKWVLVWMKKFPKGQVPDKIKADTMVQVRSRARVKAANYMMAGTVVASIIAVYIGKENRKKGDTIAKRNLEWHKKINEEYQAELAAAKSES